MEINRVIAKNLKRLRNQTGMSLTELAQKAGVSKGMLSQVENGTTNPTINTIWKICTALDIPYTMLLEEEKTPQASLVHRADITGQASDDGHFRIYSYFPQSSKHTFELFQMELDPHSKYVALGHSQQSDEFLMILEGEMTLVLDEDDAYPMKQDDTINFEATDRKHTYINNSDHMVKTIIINNYYK